ncbi:MAG: winged helix-turn-helix transcriptional regulator [Magnetococcales bacterium]|nr:winged helix-turn-helix transcriptional regulator [Magnetococcales bacterium]
MIEAPSNTSEQVLIALRQIIRAMDLQSRQLQKRHGLTTPQALILHEVARMDGITAQEVCKRVHLSRATVADIMLRLERKALIVRVRNEKDRRQVNISVTEKALKLLDETPPLLHESFVHQFNELRSWEQTQILSVFQRTADMMNAEHLDAAPLLTTESIVPHDGGSLEKMDNHPITPPEAPTPKTP